MTGAPVEGDYHLEHDQSGDGRVLSLEPQYGKSSACFEPGGALTGTFLCNDTTDPQRQLRVNVEGLLSKRGKGSKRAMTPATSTAPDVQPRH